MSKKQKTSAHAIKKQLKKVRDLSVELAEAEYELGLLGLFGIKPKSEKKIAAKIKVKPSKSSLHSLSERDQSVIASLREGKLTQTQIAKKHGIHQARVSQLKKKAGLPMLSRSEVAEKMRKANKPTKKVSSKKPTKKTTKKQKSGKKVFLSDTVFKEVKKTLAEHGLVDAAYIESKHGKSARALVTPVKNFLVDEGAIFIKKQGRVNLLVRRNKKKLQSASVKKFKTWRKA